MLDVCWSSLGLCAFDVNRTPCSALLYRGLGVQSRIVLLPGLCALDVCWPSLRLCAFDVNRPAVLPCCTWANMCSPRLCSCQDYALDMCCQSQELCAFDVNRTCCAALRYVGLYVYSRIVRLLGLYALDVCCPSLGLCASDVNRTRCATLRYVGHYG